jgi:putative ABC transport system substrate-binding protein
LRDRPSERHWATNQPASFLAAAGAALVSPSASSAQERDESRYVVASFHRGLRESGFAEGSNLTIAYRWADGHYDRLQRLAAELVQQKVAVIFAAGGPPSALAAKAATSVIPIVFSAANDAVGIGLVSNLARPGGNVTGMSTLSTGLSTKALELIRELAPKAELIAFLMNPANPTIDSVRQEAADTARALGVEVALLDASSVAQVDAAYATAAARHAAGVVVFSDPFFDSEREHIVALSRKYALPACYGWREYVEAGGLMSYGSVLTDSYRRAAIYVGRVLKGEKPGDLSGGAAVEVRARNQSEDGKSARTLTSAVPSGPRRPGDRVSRDRHGKACLCRLAPPRPVYAPAAMRCAWVKISKPSSRATAISVTPDASATRIASAVGADTAATTGAPIRAAF